MNCSVLCTFSNWLDYVYPVYTRCTQYPDEIVPILNKTQQLFYLSGVLYSYLCFSVRYLSSFQHDIQHFLYCNFHIIWNYCHIIPLLVFKSAVDYFQLEYFTLASLSLHYIFRAFFLFFKVIINYQPRFHCICRPSWFSIVCKFSKQILQVVRKTLNKTTCITYLLNIKWYILCLIVNH